MNIRTQAQKGDRNKTNTHDANVMTAPISHEIRSDAMQRGIQVIVNASTTLDSWVVCKLTMTIEETEALAARLIQAAKEARTL